MRNSIIFTAVAIVGFMSASAFANNFNSTSKLSAPIALVGETNLFKVFTFKNHNRRCWVVYTNEQDIEMDCSR